MKEHLVIPITVLLVGLLLVVAYSTREPQTTVVPPPDFSSFTNVQEKKRAFFSFMRPLIEQENAAIRSDRQFINSLIEKLDRNRTFSSSDIDKLLSLQAAYELPQTEAPDRRALRRLLRRVDTVPVSLALAQAANESAWGTSRFATDANNYFGIWCFSKGCGLVPKRRATGKTHEVASFDTPRQGVRYYLHNINTHQAYTDFRTKRAEQRTEGSLSGYALANTLLAYSERGPAYVEELRAMIRVNSLEPAR